MVGCPWCASCLSMYGVWQLMVSCISDSLVEPLFLCHQRYAICALPFLGNKGENILFVAYPLL